MAIVMIGDTEGSQRRGPRPPVPSATVLGWNLPSESLQPFLALFSDLVSERIRTKNFSHVWAQGSFLGGPPQTLQE